ncbi:MAG: FecR family protein [Spirosomataceae bacterium]
MLHRDQYKNIEDFLSDETFRRWILFKKDEMGWEEWTLENPHRAKMVDEARIWLIAMRVDDAPIEQKQIQQALQNTWQKIDNVAQEARTPIPIWRTKWWKVAAVVMIGMALGMWYKQQSNREVAGVYPTLEKKENEGLIEQINNANKPQLITLSDGSSILLQPKSKLSYPKSFEGNERKVYLSGEGFFEISKNPKKPFYVFANEVITKVIGTSFRIKAYSDELNVEVVVRTGKVSISSSKAEGLLQKEDVLLLPNQAVKFSRKQLAFEKITDLTKSPPFSSSLSSIEQLSFEFTDIPVEQIFKTIEQAYLVEIDYPAAKLKDCYLTTSLSDQPLPEKLKIVCESLGNNTHYEMNGNQILIISNGCN